MGRCEESLGSDSRLGALDHIGGSGGYGVVAVAVQTHSAQMMTAQRRQPFMSLVDTPLGQ